MQVRCPCVKACIEPPARETHYILQNIPKKLMRDALLSHLKQEGIAAISISMPMDPKQKRNAGYAFIHINDERSRDLLTAKYAGIDMSIYFPKLRPSKKLSKVALARAGAARGGV
eukprot:s3797_g7.t1